MELGERFAWGRVGSGAARHVMMVNCRACGNMAAFVAVWPEWQHEIDFAAGAGRAVGRPVFVEYESSICHIDYDRFVLAELAEADFAAYLAGIHRCEALA